MERMEQMAALSSEIFRENLISDVFQILTSLDQKQEDVQESVSMVLSNVLLDAFQKQKETTKGPVAYISFSVLQSNILLNRYVYRVDAWDERFYIDDNEATADWDFYFLTNGAKPDMLAISKKLRETMTRIQEYELKELECAYRTNHFAIAMEILSAAIPFCTTPMADSPALLAPEVQFTVGAYMEKQQPFFTWRAET